MASWSNWSFQNANSPMMEQLIFFHDHTMMVIMIITVMVGYMLMSLTLKSFNNRMLMENQMIELIWTIIPAILLIFIAMPSIQALYMIEESNKPMLTIKTVGHQWYWSYEYSDFKKIEFEAYMKPTQEIDSKEFRVLETDNKLIIPYKTQTRILMTSTDVIHSWAMPTLGIKVDSSPGRINQGNFMTNRPGVYYGQCSEICGANHSFMPIMMESVNPNTFIKWIKNF
uniref:Cytochrome c oxidase subunit 2 n=1 Tax=Limassolla sp. XZ-2020 TaxID=2783704 RepID=A0A872PK84_9HEMI|nr:cytochrome c oxidase subunit II [Limassolla sp. XZ-2020]